MRADLQRFYGINLDDMYEGRISAEQVMACIAYLPLDGAVASVKTGAPAWGFDTHILANMANSLKYLAWAKTKDAQRGRNKPHYIEPPAPEDEKPKAEQDEVKEILARKRI